MRKTLFIVALALTLVLAGSALALAAPTHEVEDSAELTDAIANAASGDTIQLTDDIDTLSELAVMYKINGKDLTLDLNSCTLAGKATGNDGNTDFIRVENGATLTITDSSSDKDGKISATYLANSNLSVVDVYDTSKLILQAGQITNENTINYGGACVYLRGTSSFEMTGGEVSAVKNTLVNKKVNAVWMTANTDCSISGGTISTEDSGISAQSGLSISGGSFNNKTFPGAQYLASDSYVLWSDIETCSVVNALPTSHEAEIQLVSHSEYYTDADAALAKAAAGNTVRLLASATDPVSLTIPFKKTIALILDPEASIASGDIWVAGTLTVNGSGINDSVIKPAEGYVLSTATEGDTTTYTASSTEQSGGAVLIRDGADPAYYANLSNAYTEAIAGDTIKLLKDVDLGTSKFALAKNLTLDLNSHEIRSSYRYGTSEGYVMDVTSAAAIIDTAGGGKITHTGPITSDPKNYGIYFNKSGSTLTLSNITVSSPHGVGVYVNSGSVLINSGSYTGSTYGLQVRSLSSAGAAIEGGSFVGGTAAVMKGASGTLSISGGTFSDLSCIGYLEDGADVEIELASDITLSQTVTIDTESDVTLDLNGKSITGTNCRVFLISKGTLELTGTGTISSTHTAGDGSFAAGSSVVRLSGATGAAALVIGKDVTIGSDYCYGVTAFGNASNLKTVTVNGTISVTGEAGALSGNGSDEQGNTVFNINNGAVVSSTSDTAIYHPQSGILNVTGGEITGLDSAIAIKAGTLNISGGKITATGENTIPTEGYSNGINASGAAIQIESNDDYSGDIKVNITGGTIVSQQGYALYEYLDNGEREGSSDVPPTTATEVSSISISGGSLSGKLGIFMVSENLRLANPQKITITGGYFSADPSVYVVSGYRVTRNGEIYRVHDISSDDDDNPPTKPAGGDQTASGSGGVEIPFSQSGGRVELDISNTTLNELLDNVPGSGLITLNASGVEGCETVSLDASALKKIADAVNEEGSGLTGLCVDTPAASLEIDAAALSQIAGLSANGQVSFNVTTTSPDDLSQSQQDAITAAGGNPAASLVVDVTIKSGSTTVTDLGGGQIGVTLDFQPGLDLSGVTVYYLNEQGLLEPVQCLYDQFTGKVTMILDHLSRYIVTYSAENAWVNPFTDVHTGDWFYEAVKFVNIKGLFNGVSATAFAPRTTLDRAMFTTALWRHAGAEVYQSRFTDVPEDAYYAAATGWANYQGVINGVTSTEFGPGLPITREMIVTILYRHSGFTLEEASLLPDQLAGFSDTAQISEYALSAMNWAVAKGIIQGNGGKLNPKSTASRAEAAAMLMRYASL